MKQIPINGINGQNKFALVDDEDYLVCMFYLWYADKDNYVRRKEGGKAIRLHQQVMNVYDSIIDHINCNPLDNQKSNLRIVTKSQNALNRQKPSKRNKSGTIGVHQIWNGTWQASARVEGATRHLGTFKTLDEAVKARRAFELITDIRPCSTL